MRPAAECGEGRHAAAHFAADGTALSEKGYAFVGDWQAKYLRYIHSVGWGVDPAFVHPKAERERMARRTQRLHDAKWGVFNHYLGHEVKTAAAWEAKVNSFDVKKVADQLEAVGARFYFITLMQGRRWICAPNETYDRIAGTKPGEACSTRDIPAELIAALKPLGVKVMLYLPCQPPNADRHAAEAFGFAPGAEGAKPHDRAINAVAARRWGEVIEEWSRRYGKDVVGWWFDAGYRHIRFNDEIAAIYAAAVKRGNPDAVVAFNEGVKSPMRRWTLAGDYLAGEVNEPFREVCGGRWSDDRQWQLLTFAGSFWGKNDCRFTDAQWIGWMRPILKNGGAVTIDLAIDCPSGRLDPAQAAQLKRVFSAAR